MLLAGRVIPEVWRGEWYSVDEKKKQLAGVTYHATSGCRKVTLQLWLNDLKQGIRTKHGSSFQLTSYFQKTMSSKLTNKMIDEL